MDAFPTGSSQSIEVLLAESAWVRGLAARLVGPDEAEDLAQETWLRAVRKPPALDRPVRPWLATVVRNLARQRAAKRTELVDSDEAQRAPASPDAPEVWIERLETQELLSRLVRELPAEDRDVVLLRFYEGLDSRAIGRRLGQPDATVRWRLKRSVERLRERLDARHDGDRSAWMAALVPLARLDSAPVQAGALSTLLMIGIAMPLTLKLTLGATTALLLVWFVRQPDEVNIAPLLAGNEAVQAGDEALSVPERIATVQPTSPPTNANRKVAPSDLDGPSVTSSARPETSLTLRAVDDRGVPIAGALLRVTRGSTFGNNDDEGVQEGFDDFSPSELAIIAAGGIEAMTGSDGRARLASKLVTTRSWISLNVVGPNYGLWRDRRQVDPGDVVDLGDVVLTPGGAITGRVYDDVGAPLAAIVRLTPAPDSAANLDDSERNELRIGGPGISDLPGTNSNRTGDYALAGVPAGRYYVWAHAIGRPGLWSWSEPIDVVLGERTEVDLHVATEELAPHILVLTPDGEPRPKASVEFVRPNGYRQSGSADEDGRYFVGKLFQPGMSVTVADNRGEFGPNSIDLMRSMNTVVLRLTRIETVERRLVVRGPDGQAIEDGRVRVDVQDTDTWYRLADEPPTLHLPPGDAAFDLMVRSSGWETRHLTATSIKELTDTDTITITLEPLTGIRGRVVTNGEPVARAWVHLGTPMDETGWAHKDGVVSRAAWAQPVRTESDGSFVFLVADPGQRVLCAERGGRNGGRSAPFLIEDYDPHVGRTDVELVLEATAELEGRVADAEGNPMVGRYVAAAHPHLPGESARTDEAGQYRFCALAAGDWYVYLLQGSPGGGNGTMTGNKAMEFPSNVSLAPNETGRHDFRLGTQTLRLDHAFEVPSEQAPTLTATVYRTNPAIPINSGWQGDEVGLSLDPDVTEFRLDHAGKHTLVISVDSAAGARSYLRRQFEVDPDGTVTLAVDRSWQLIAGQVAFFGEADSHDLHLSAELGDWSWSLRTKLDEHGSFGPVLAPRGALTFSRNVRRGSARETAKTHLDVSAGSSDAVVID